MTWTKLEQKNNETKNERRASSIFFPQSDLKPIPFLARFLLERRNRIVPTPLLSEESRRVACAFGSDHFHCSESDSAMSSTTTPAVVMDIGSGFTKAGIAGFDGPQVVMPTAIARSRTPKSPSIFLEARYVGSKAVSKFMSHRVAFPVTYDMTTDWDAIEEILTATYQDELGLNANEHPVHFFESPCMCHYCS
jgi:hypothetical protein